MTIRQTLLEAKERLRYVCERPLFEAEILLAHHLRKDRIYLKMHDDEQMRDQAGFEALIARRAAHEPMEYITRRVSFYDMELYIAPGALIPRPETEILVERAASLVKKSGFVSVAEIGVGSGAISAALARKFPQLHIAATDISTEALGIARRNIETFDLQERVMLHHTSLLDGVEGEFEMIVSNPPYISTHTLLAPNVAEYEPAEALYGGENGDEILRQIIRLAAEREVRYLLCEMGYDQKKSIESFADLSGAVEVEFYKDYAGLDRGFIIRYK